ncbi:MAG: LssY C-terminal domain-containing protein [Bryobacterales bacterium]|nr:LssY C-terminal domain-containing protein [Bryobacterales bacterium]MBV9396874.1 LssY C-terminal domain-containing protein [Bryobacterales bacterium]
MGRFALLLLASVLLHAQTKGVTVTPDDWLDTGIDLRAGDVVVITSTGAVTLAQGRTAGPAGNARGFRDLLKTYPVNEAGQAALIGRIGSSDAAVPFLVGEAKRLEVPRSGRLFLWMNKSGNDTITGKFQASIEFKSRGPEKAVSIDDSKLPKVTLDIVDRIPRRVTDLAGDSGDNTNFVIPASEQRVLGVFQAAGWVQVNKTREGALVTGLIQTLSKQAYLELPMSELMLFGRNQDYGLAHAEPIAVVAQRHHLRLWKAPFKVDGEELWVGAATHDVGFDRDARNNGITHKIDPNIDDEREFVGRSLEETGRVAKLSYIMPSKPSKEARTATGATFHSDGRVLVIQLVPETTSAAR